jgi:hypothetical protein
MLACFGEEGASSARTGRAVQLTLAVDWHRTLYLNFECSSVCLSIYFLSSPPSHRRPRPTILPERCPAVDINCAQSLKDGETAVAFHVLAPHLGMKR